MKLHHLALGSPNVERAASFYVKVIGLRELQRHNDSSGELRSIWLTLDDAILMIERTQEPLRPVSGVGSGLFLIAFRVQPDGRREIEQRLIEYGQIIEAASEWTFYTRDPDGNRLAFSYYPLPTS
ncbi:MAG TPA: VOC family protein [Polyangiaceae bacterium]|nr:VOC family protein [Polyangiaceae bacterium]